MTATAVSSVSLDPPLILVCVSPRSRFHDAVLAAGAGRCRCSRPTRSRWPALLPARARLATPVRRRAMFRRRNPARRCDRLPGLVDCRTFAAYDGGDHTIVVGELVATSREAAPKPPLTYYQGSYNVGRTTT